MKRSFKPLMSIHLAALAMLFIACSHQPVSILYVGGIPDQDESIVVRRFSGLSDYLSQTLGMEVRYVPSIDYAAVVTGFVNGHIHLAWYGGLTGVQARAAVPGARAIAQRPRDTEFRSVFVVNTKIPAETLSDLKNTRFTFGSESSTSGHLMPRYFLLQEGINADKDFRGLPNFSGSHDKTWKLVEVGAFESGALNKSVWDTAVLQGQINLEKVRLLEVTEPYYDYNWSVRPDLDQHFGDGFTHNLSVALLEMHMSETNKDILELFYTDKFIASDNDNYKVIEDVARRLKILE